MKPRLIKSCNEVRAYMNKATPAQRAALHKRGLALIEAGSKRGKLITSIKQARKLLETPLFDSVLASQLKALGCSFNLVASPHYGIALHIGAPEEFWTQPQRLLDLVRTVHPSAVFAISDAEGCISVALEGMS